MLSAINTIDRIIAEFVNEATIHEASLIYYNTLYLQKNYSTACTSTCIYLYSIPLYLIQSYIF